MIKTPLGAEVSVLTAPEHLGPGVLVISVMSDPKDPRRSEVYLDRQAQLQLAQELLTNYLQEHQL